MNPFYLDSDDDDNEFLELDFSVFEDGLTVRNLIEMALGELQENPYLFGLEACRSIDEYLRSALKLAKVERTIEFEPVEQVFFGKN